MERRKGEEGRRGNKGQTTEEKGERLGKDAEESGRGPDRKFAGKRWEGMEGGGKDVAEKKEWLWLWSHPIPLLGPRSGKGGPGGLYTKPTPAICSGRGRG